MLEAKGEGAGRERGSEENGGLEKVRCALGRESSSWASALDTWRPNLHCMLSSLYVRANQGGLSDKVYY